jgi:aspartyl protease family protein
MKFVIRSDLGAKTCLVALILWGIFPVYLSSPVAAESLRAHLETLAAERGFELKGSNLIGDEDATVARSAGAADRIDQLLANYNFVVTRDPRGRIAELTVVGLRASPLVPSDVQELIETSRTRGEHYVEAIIQGPNGRDLPLNVMVDTGASTLVLPRSLIISLGYRRDHLDSVQVQTANGLTNGLSATLRSVRVGDAETAGVAVTFVDDDLLGGKRLLGMSFLGRFRVTIDGSKGLLQLENQGR